MNLLIRQTALRVARSMQALPHGVHLASDLLRLYPDFSPRMIFDVGANVGKTVQQFLADFPGTRLMAFEPDPLSYSKLSARIGHSARVQTFNIGLTDRACRLRFDNSSPISEIHAVAVDQTVETLPFIEFSTVDKICDEYSVTRIGLLKIDTEGHDLKVLRGATTMLTSKAIDVVFAECSISSANSGLVPFRDIEAEMTRYGYRLFGFYHQTALPNLTYANCAFVSPSRSVR